MRAVALAAFFVLAAPAAGADYAGLVLPTPIPCDAVPGADTLLGTPGSAGCYVPRDATRPTVVQAANVTTDSSGTWSVTWARPFVSSSPVVNPLPVNSGALPILCNVAARSGSGASGKCWQSTSTTLPGTLATLVGLIISPFAAPASNASVMVIAREPTQ
ncbi:hypothetical protein MKK88_05840 [Methylobacterium sp. E-005]|uniref:hypothetical protein n=1 Tax=Methylobacterium sp. E-005 TaxID=2836549 RepID=UPI001FBB8B5D|nr:hypothetical protein [Methylobacterium sp. E-005]MCJ2085516.1 hypothetical protein [Methylobacterium sp. E-005]